MDGVDGDDDDVAARDDIFKEEARLNLSLEDKVPATRRRKEKVEKLVSLLMELKDYY